MTKELYMTLTLGMVALFACKEPSPPAPPTPTGEFCEQADQRIRNCIAQGERHLVADTADGQTFAQVCLRVEKEGKVSMRADCIAQAPTCDEVVECQTKLG